MNENVVSEVIEVDSEYKCNELLNTGYYIFLNCYTVTYESKQFPGVPTQQIYYCLGKISY